MDWDGNLLWMFDPNATDLDLHHDFHRRTNGFTAAITRRRRVVPSINPGEIFDDTIVFVNAAGQKLGEWSAADHYDQLGLSQQTKNLIAGLPSGPHDVFHTNSIQELPANPWEATDPRFRKGNILVSMRSLNRVFIISVATRNVVWILNVATIGQHHASMIEPGLPGAGNILLFDNGGMAGYPQQCRLYSRVLEIDPVSQSVVWQYDTQSAGPSNSALRHTFFSARVSSAQRLPNGNTLITEGDLGRIFEVKTEGTIVWEVRQVGLHQGLPRLPRRLRMADRSDSALVLVGGSRSVPYADLRRPARFRTVSS